MASKRVPYLDSAKPGLLPEPNFSARKSVFRKVVNFPSRFFPRWKWYFRSNYDWKISFLTPDGISGKKSTISRISREYLHILQLVPPILKCTLVCLLCFKDVYKKTSLYVYPFPLSPSLRTGPRSHLNSAENTSFIRAVALEICKGMEIGKKLLTGGGWIFQNTWQG